MLPTMSYQESEEKKLKTETKMRFQYIEFIKKRHFKIDDSDLSKKRKKKIAWKEILNANERNKYRKSQ